MPFYYCSFADPERPKGLQFLGATIIEAKTDFDVMPALWSSGRNPGGEIQFAQIDISGREDLEPIAQKYFDRFVGRDEAVADPHEKWED